MDSESPITPQHSDQPAKAPHKRTRNKRVAKRTEKAISDYQLLNGDLLDEKFPLTAWMKQYAMWLTVQATGRTKNTEHERAVASWTGYIIGFHTLRGVRKRKDFQAFQQSVSADMVERAKQRIIGDLPYYAETHRKATEGLMEAAKEDPRAYGKVAALTSPMIDRAMPKKEERVDRQSVVVIHLGRIDSEAAKLLKKVEDVVDVEWEEVLPDEPA